MRTIIACGGPQKYWGNYLGVTSHFAPIDTAGNPLIKRTIFQALEHCEDVMMTVPYENAEPYMDICRRYALTPLVSGSETWNEYHNSEPFWNSEGRTVLLLGDVYFTDAAMHRIYKSAHVNQKNYQVYGRYGKSRITGTPYGEIFAASWWTKHHDMISRHLQRIHATFMAQESNRQDGWTLLRSIQGTPLNKHRVDPRFFVEINDWTDDLDKPEDYMRHPKTKDLPRGE